MYTILGDAIRAEKIGFTPKPGDKVEFTSDSQVEPGPCTGEVISNDGNVSKVKCSNDEVYDLVNSNVEAASVDSQQSRWTLV